MAQTFVNFYSALDQRGGQAFGGAASQAHRADAAVGANVSAASKIDLANTTKYVEVKATIGNVFICILPSGADDAARTAAAIRIDEGERIAVARDPDFIAQNSSLFIWAV